jgi:hypothetical protein
VRFEHKCVRPEHFPVLEQHSFLLEAQAFVVGTQFPVVEPQAFVVEEHPSAEALARNEKGRRCRRPWLHPKEALTQCASVVASPMRMP